MKYYCQFVSYSAGNIIYFEVYILDSILHCPDMCVTVLITASIIIFYAHYEELRWWGRYAQCVP